jgi:hypothetical protein
MSIGRRAHGVPDQIVTAGLAGALERHVAPKWYGCILFSDGYGVLMPSASEVGPPAEHVVNWMAHTAAALNVEAHTGGHWVVAWSHDSQEAVLLWRDGDGHAHVAIEIAAKPDRIEEYTPDRVVNLGIQGVTEYRQRFAMLALTEKQITRAPSARGHLTRAH